MATLNNRHEPNFLLLPINNNRTAWRPFGLPVVLVIPHRRAAGGEAIANSGVFNLRIYIEDVPREALVAGHDNIGQRFPDNELYSETIDSLELADRYVDPTEYTFYSNDEITTNPKEGDTFRFTTSTGIVDDVPYLPDADYYDLSDIKLDLELLPSDIYNLVYETNYFSRVISQDKLQEFLCVDINVTSTARLKFKLNHPGDIIDEFYNLTPPPYLTNTTKALDTTIGLYRPFTDMLQDIFDEQNLLESINWVFEIPPEAIPYASSLLGWELPYFPQSLDRLRRAVLRRTVEFQNLSGSRRAIINIFRLFGFEILISNLWWSSDGKRFIRPGKSLPAPYEDEEISISNVCQIDLALNDFNDQGFNELSIPLIFRPQIQATFGDFATIRDGGDITIEAYTVTNGSQAHTKLKAISDAIIADPENYGSIDGCFTDANGFINSNTIVNELDGVNVDGFSQVLISGKLGQPSDETLVGQAPLTSQAISFDRENNTLSLSLNGYFDSSSQSIFMFVIYERQKLVVPDIIEDLKSNRFDIQVLTQDLKEFADPTTLEFAIEFLYRLKAFHSLLNIINTRIELTETYEVTDWCVGGDTAMRFDIDAGQLQVPPAIIPDIPGAINDCSLLDPQSLGYKEDDIILRLRKLANLPEEHEAWKILDSRSSNPGEGLALQPPQSASDRDTCKYTYRGQDRVTGDRVESRDTQPNPPPNAAQQIAGVPENPKSSPNDTINNGEFDASGPLVSSNSNSSAYSSFNREYTKIRDSFCELDGIQDYCYKGRVDDELLFRSTLIDTDHPRCKPCDVGMGVGIYYMYPVYSKIIVPGTKKPCPNSNTSSIEFSGNAKEGNTRFFQTGIQKNYITASHDAPLSAKNNSHLGRLYRAYNNPSEQTIHYSNRKGMPNPDQRYNIALERPNLVIEKPTLHLPGCRFPTLNKLENDFTHPTWDARPWDDAYSTYCGPKYICGSTEPSLLNYSLGTDTNGDEVLTFDSASFSILGNGLVADIPSFGDHSLGSNTSITESDVIHSVYMDGADDSPYVVLDQVCEYDSTATDGYVSTDDPIFSSHNECNTGEIIDFADGYACLSGSQDYNGEDFSDWSEVLDGLGMPTSVGTGLDIIFLLGSGIRDSDTKTFRLDCGCLLAGCDETIDGDTICNADLFLDDDGNYDWEPDHLQLELRLKMVEEMGACSIRLDGTIGSLLEVS